MIRGGCLKESGDCSSSVYLWHEGGKNRRIFKDSFKESTMNATFSFKQIQYFISNGRDNF